ncbi:MAG: NAD(P)-dependent oxidoreductase [Verrucomicrobia bacterium]|nr:NAD(P)-dependent oxidoreductase [Verrucomicrobiota bacterium]
MNVTSMLAAHHERKFVQADLKAVIAAHGVYHHLDWCADNPPPEQDLLDALAETDVLLTGRGTPPLPESLLTEPNRRLQYICNLSGSIRPFVPRAYLDAGIRVTNWGNGPMWYLAEGTLALMLACSREMSRVAEHMRRQPQWTFPYRSPSPTLRHKTLGYLGFGAIARLLHDLMAPFGCRTRVYDPYASSLPSTVTQVDNPMSLFAQADVLVVFCGLNDETTGLVNRQLLDQLPPHAIFINTARGRIVVENDLIEFLHDRPDVMAGLDVYEVEPLPTDSPILDLDNVIAYPHSVGGGGDDMFRAASAYAAANLAAFCEGQTLQAQITPAIYDRMT